MKYTYEGNPHKFSQNRIPMNPWDLYNTWRRHQMETCSALLAHSFFHGKIFLLHTIVNKQGMHLVLYIVANYTKAVKMEVLGTIYRPRSTATVSKHVSSGWCDDDHGKLSWWRHQMETFSALLALCAGNSPRWNPLTKASDAELWCFLSSGPLFTKRMDVLPQDLVNSQSREIRV